jgi:putative ABC transport system substrate-binding protein
LALAILSAPLAAAAQPPGKVPRIGVLEYAHPPSCISPSFLSALHELGYVEGQNIRLEGRCAEGRADLARQFADELVQLPVDIIVSHFRAATLAAKAATRTIPILFVGNGYPVPELVPSLARPGGNVTGVTNIPGWEFFAKQLDLLMMAVPGLPRVALLLAAGDPFNADHTTPVETAARAVGVHLHPVEVEVPHSFEAAFSAMTRQGVGGLLVAFTPRFTAQYHAQIAALAVKNQLPAVGPGAFARRGGLMSYGRTEAELWRRATSQLDRILKGAKPADLPVEQPMKFDLVINLKTAKALGITMPPSLLLLADEVIQ